MNTDEKKKLKELLEGISTFMLVTNDQDGTYSARPMATVSLNDNLEFHFFTSADAKVPYEISGDHNVLLTYQDGSKFLTLKGSATAAQNTQKAKELWRETFRVWFPDGAEDPMLILITFRLEAAEYWDNEGLNKIKYAFEAVKAYATGTRPEVDEPSQHGKLTV